MKKNILKKDTKDESELQRVYLYSIYPRDSKIYSDKGFINKDDGSQGGTHWNFFIVKDGKSYCFGTVLEYNQINFYLNN